MRKTIGVCILFFGALVVAGASTIWDQQWDTTPVNPPATINEIIIYADSHTGLEFGDPLTDFVPYDGSSADVSGWTSVLVNPWEVEASGPAVAGQDFAFNINFSTPLSTPGYLMFEYFNNGQLVTPPGNVNPQQWYYDGSGTGNNPVSSWSQRSSEDFGAVPEPGTIMLVGSGLLIFAGVFRRRLQR